MLRSLYFTSLIITCNHLEVHTGKHWPMVEISTHWSVWCLSGIVSLLPLHSQSQAEPCNSSGVLKCPSHCNKRMARQHFPMKEIYGRVYNQISCIVLRPSHSSKIWHNTLIGLFYFQIHAKSMSNIKLQYIERKMHHKQFSAIEFVILFA